MSLYIYIFATRRFNNNKKTYLNFEALYSKELLAKKNKYIVFTQSNPLKSSFINFYKMLC